MKKKNNQVVLQKIPLEPFIKTLEELYQEGANYVDIVGIANQDQDVMNLIVKIEYMDPEVVGFIPEGEENILSDDDINQLI